MDVIEYVERLAEAEDPASRFPTAQEIVNVLRLHLNKRENLGQLHEIRNRLLIGARALLRNTVRLNALIDEPDFEKTMANLTGKQIPRGYWASHLLSIPLLRSATDQLAKAQNGPSIALAIARLVGAVEDQPEPVESPRSPRIKGFDPTYHQIYKYLTKLDGGWGPERVQWFDDALAALSDRLVAQVAQRVAKGRPVAQPRPMGW
jgi:hypothetical protein